MAHLPHGHPASQTGSGRAAELHVEDGPGEATVAGQTASLEPIPERERNELIQSHLGLVVVIARRYADRGVALADLVAEGNAGLVRAAARFDPTRGIRFSSYAFPWIEHAVRAACMQYRDVITIPSAMKRLIYAYRRLSASRERGNEPSIAEVARELEIPHDAAAAVVAAASSSRASSSQGEAYDALRFVAAPESGEPSDPLEARDTIDAVASAMGLLGPLERRVVGMHFGLEGHKPSTRAAIAAELGVLPECVDWTLNRALGRLRATLSRQKVA